MAGTIVVSTLVKIVGEKLGSALLKEFSSLWGVKNDLEELESAISTIRDVLDDAEQCGLKKQVYNWLMKLKDVVYDAGDLLDKIYLEAEKRKTKSYDKDSIFGRDNERENIVSQLKQIDGNQNVSIIAIVGLGGVGKTTLAKLAYNEDELKGYFNLKIWVYVSQDFNIGNIVRAMMDSVSKGECKLQNPSNLAEELQKYLNGKRFLIVLDDIWNENQEEWEKLKVILKCGASGSKIIATTRSTKVSEIIESTSTIKLKGLSEEMSWTLFEQKAFNISEREPNSQILEIAKEIVKKCGGVPLALKALGSTMRSKKSFKEWLAIRDSEIWKIDSENRVMASLRLSYSNFPSQLKECFAYCSILPKGRPIYKDGLINQWIAHTRSMACMEVHKGNEYFDQLVQVSFLQNIDQDSYFRESCNMHDLVHDLAQSIAGQRFLLIKDRETVANKVKSCKYMSLVDFEGKMKPTDIKKVRALHIKGGDPNVIGIISKAQSMRSLFIESIKIDTLPSHISKLIHLRYICISGCELTLIPHDICALWNLQTLSLMWCEKITYLPESIGKLISLRTLKLNHNNLKCLPESVGNLQNLRVMNLRDCRNLEEVPVSIGNLISLECLNLSNCRSLKCLPESVGNLQNLCVMNLHYCDNLEEVPASIGNLVSLEILNLSCCRKLKYLPESIGNLLNLYDMNLDNSGIETLPSGICELSNLVSLNLIVNQKIDLPVCLGNMKKLKYLHISTLPLNGMPIGISKLTDMRVLNSFHVSGENKYASISELEHLNFLSEKLIISGLENLNNPREAIQANLKEKKNLDHLGLIWYIGADFLNERFGHWCCVLEALQPPSSIKSLQIKDYPGAEYPNWMMVLSENNTAKFPYLTSLTLSNFKQCSSLPSLAELPQLKYLILEGMLNLTTISGHFPSLVTLQLCEMPNLEEVTTMKLDIENVSKPAFPRLSELVISGCPKVRIQPRLPSSVVELELEKSNDELLGVEFLNGESSSEICSQPLGIRELKISEMETELVLLKHLSSLTRLQFSWCERNCLPESMRYLSSLRELDIYNCKGLHALPEWIGELKSLEVLRIWWTPLTCLPESMKHMSSLRQLTFGVCKGLRVLPEWFGELKSLKDLTIEETPLTCLPKSMKQLTALEILCIVQCPELERRCEREKGEDWHLISHIPSVYIW